MKPMELVKIDCEMPTSSNVQNRTRQDHNIISVLLLTVFYANERNIPEISAMTCFQYRTINVMYIILCTLRPKQCRSICKNLVYITLT